MKYNPFDIYTDEYEDWFKKNEILLQTELLALKQLVPVGKKGIEIGIGSGIFAEKLDVRYGIDPSDKMLNYARQRKLNVVKGIAENLPYQDNSFDFAVFITSICFIENPGKALQEASRILKEKGELIIAFIDKQSPYGQSLIAEKQQNKFYGTANFYSATEMISLIEKNNFEIDQIFQTLTDLKTKQIEKPVEGYGIGSFVVIKGIKKTTGKNV